MAEPQACGSLGSLVPCGVPGRDGDLLVVVGRGLARASGAAPRRLSAGGVLLPEVVVCGVAEVAYFTASPASSPACRTCGHLDRPVVLAGRALFDLDLLSFFFNRRLGHHATSLFLRLVRN